MSCRKMSNRCMQGLPKAEKFKIKNWDVIWWTPCIMILKRVLLPYRIEMGSLEDILQMKEIPTEEAFTEIIMVKNKMEVKVKNMLTEEASKGMIKMEVIVEGEIKEIQTEEDTLGEMKMIMVIL